MVDHFRNGWLYLLVWPAAPVVCCPRLLPRYYLVSTCFLKAQLDWSIFEARQGLPWIGYKTSTSRDSFSSGRSCNTSEPLVSMCSFFCRVSSPRRSIYFKCLERSNAEHFLRPFGIKCTSMGLAALQWCCCSVWARNQFSRKPVLSRAGKLGNVIQHWTCLANNSLNFRTGCHQNIKMEQVIQETTGVANL